jgi:hypothetical protein
LAFTPARISRCAPLTIGVVAIAAGMLSVCVWLERHNGAHDDHHDQFGRQRRR